MATNSSHGHDCALSGCSGLDSRNIRRSASLVAHQVISFNIFDIGGNTSLSKVLPF